MCGGGVGWLVGWLPRAARCLSVSARRGGSVLGALWVRDRVGAPW